MKYVYCQLADLGLLLAKLQHLPIRNTSLKHHVLIAIDDTHNINGNKDSLANRDSRRVSWLLD